MEEQEKAEDTVEGVDLHNPVLKAALLETGGKCEMRYAAKQSKMRENCHPQM
jgi:hypothetical protein